jgi:hypothetical protein
VGKKVVDGRSQDEVEDRYFDGKIRQVDGDIDMKDQDGLSQS